MNLNEKREKAIGEIERFSLANETTPLVVAFAEGDSYVCHFDSFEELVGYIRERHACYLESPRCIADDIRFILRVCYQVIQGIFQLCLRRQFHMEGRPVTAI